MFVGHENLNVHLMLLTEEDSRLNNEPVRSYII